MTDLALCEVDPMIRNTYTIPQHFVMTDWGILASNLCRFLEDNFGRRSFSLHFPETDFGTYRMSIHNWKYKQSCTL
jgi:hypothetical protein